MWRFSFGSNWTAPLRTPRLRDTGDDGRGGLRSFSISLNMKMKALQKCGAFVLDEIEPSLYLFQMQNQIKFWIKVRT